MPSLALFNDLIQEITYFSMYIANPLMLPRPFVNEGQKTKGYCGWYCWASVLIRMMSAAFGFFTLFKVPRFITRRCTVSGWSLI